MKRPRPDASPRDASPPAGDAALNHALARGIAVSLIRDSGLFDAVYYAAQGALPEGVDPVTDFCESGWRAGRKPDPYFDPDFYLKANPDVAAAGLNPLLHYLEFGDAEGRDPSLWFQAGWYRREYGVPPEDNALAHYLVRRTSGQVSPVPLFDPAWYLAANPDVAAAGADPFEHFIRFGEAEHRDPAPGFDIKFYRTRYATELGGQNPLLHYIAHRHQGFQPVRPSYERLIAGAVQAATRPAPEFEAVLRLPASAPRQARLLAYYLPQFHPIPENDAWWGRGFTDWTNLARATPRFAGHRQPRVPRDLGYYALDDPRTLPRQIDLARGAGIAGFVFYYYWFNGKRLLEAPLDQLRADKSIDFPFCLLWANENWTRRWDGLEREVLLAQEYDPADDAALVDDLAGYLKDPRYIRLQGRPLLMIYRAAIIPDSKATIARWRGLFRARHGEDPLIFMAQSFHDNDPLPHGLDGAVEFPPHKLVVGLPPLNQILDLFDPEFTADVFAYDDVVAASLASPRPAYPLIRCAAPGWDNDPRREGKGVVLQGATPAAYQSWLKALIDQARAHPVQGAALVCVNAWNEWAEGAYLEPDTHFGAAFLNATARAVSGQAAASAARHLLLVGHDALPHGAQLLLLHLARQFRRAHGIIPHILLLGGGPLKAAYEREGEVKIAPDAPMLASLIAAWRRQGIRQAIVNTAASARLVEELAEAGIAATLLIHEMPRLLDERCLRGVAKRGLAAARAAVFASAYLRDRVCAALDVQPRAIILPQGNYQRVAFSAEARRAFRRRLGLSDAEFLILGVGFADLRKGFDLFLQLWRLLSRRRDIHFLWLGDAHAWIEDYLGAEIKAAKADGRFHRLPFAEDVGPAYSGADLYALTSREDPFPSTVIEAMAAGLPSVAFEDSGGIPDLLRDTAAGTAVPAGDVQGFAEAILSRLDGAALAADRNRLIGIASKRFDFAAYAAALLATAHPGLRRIAAVIPNHDYARYLPARLGSVFGQTYPVAAVTLLDDASTDDSLAQAAAVAADWDRALAVEVNDQNTGSPFAAWRRAARIDSDFVWIAEADDAAEPGFLTRLADAMGQASNQARNPVLAFTDSRAIGPDGATLMPDYQRYYAESGAPGLARSGIFSARDFARLYLAERNLILNVSAVVFNTKALASALDRIGAELAEWRVAGDWRVYLELLAGPDGEEGDGEVVYLAEPLNLHRRHEHGVTHGLDKTRHFDEIARMQALARDRLRLNAGEIARQTAYLDTLARQFGIQPGKPPPRRVARGG
jgi:glycosyltransferase involved in cell wall biosynthesis